MIIVNGNFDEQVYLNSKALIQPIINSNKYIIADLTNPVLDQA